MNIKKATRKEKAHLKEIAKRLKIIFPNAKTELEYKNDFQLLVAIIMSAQSTDKQVNKVNKIFFEQFSTPEDLVKLWVENIKKYINTIGLYNSKAKHIFEASKMLVDKYQSRIPENLDEIQKLPWVGIKTGKVWLSVVKEMHYLAVDTHVHRVLNRLWVVHTKTPEETDRVMSQKFDGEDLADLHHTLVLYGRYICTARSPKCSESILWEFCKH